MKIGNIRIQQAHGDGYYGQTADALIIVVPAKTFFMPLRLLIKRGSISWRDVMYCLLVNVFAGSECGYVALHKR